MPVSNRRFGAELLAAMAIALNLAGFAVLADEPVVTTKPLPPALPEVFAKPAPESIADLKALEGHLKQLLPRLQAATVAVRIREAHGSGVIVSSNGLVMTAGHVSGRPGREVEVTLPDGSRAFGHTLGRNKNLDSGLIQIDGGRTDWPFCPLVAQSTTTERPVKTGDWCVTLGHPGGYQAGRSAPVRLGRVMRQMNRLIQTDCELVGGDSGGPLFNMQGEVIGINSRIGEELEFNFHVPTRVYQREWTELNASRDLDGNEDLDGDGSHGAMLGLSGQPAPAGLKITKVYADEPAEWGGIQVGDILVTFDGRQVSDMARLIELVGDLLPGDEVKIELLRNGKPVSVTVELDLKWK